jgi:AraC-like DNA-binding protein
MIVGVLVWDQLSRARLAEAAKGRALLRYCEAQPELSALVENGLVGVVVVDVRDRSGESTLETVRLLKQRFPSVPVLLYSTLRPALSREMLVFARAGVNDLVIRDVDDVKHTLVAALSNAADTVSLSSLVSEIEPLLPSNVVPMVRYCVENGRRPLSVEDVASALSVHRKTLVERLGAAGLPTPSSMIAWCRLLVSARILEDPGRSVEQVALMLNFPSSTSLRNMVKRYTGLRTNEVRQNGGARCVLHAFKRYLTVGGIPANTRPRTRLRAPEIGPRPVVNQPEG